MFILENLKLVVILSALLYGFLFGQLISDVSFTNIGGCLSGAHQGLLTHPFEQVLADYLYERYSQQISFFQRGSEK